MFPQILPFYKINLQDEPRVGYKNAALGEMSQHLQKEGINVPDGFAVIQKTYRDFLRYNHIESSIHYKLDQLDRSNYSNLTLIGRRIRQTILEGDLPYKAQISILAAFTELSERLEKDICVAVRSSITLNGGNRISFAGQHDNFLHINHPEHLLEACRHCYASLFTDRAIKFREEQQIDHQHVGLSLFVQTMVRSDLASSGTGCVTNPKSPVTIHGYWGLGECSWKKTIIPDKYVVTTSTTNSSEVMNIYKKLGSKERMIIIKDQKSSHQDFFETTQMISTPLEKRNTFTLQESEVKTLTRWGRSMYRQFGKPTDFEWAKDGIEGQLYIVQAGFR